MSDDVRAFLRLAKRSRSLGAVYPGAILRGFPIPHLDFRGCADPILQFLRYFADHPGPTNGPNFSHGLAVYTKEHERDD
jgi:hypothetical protein